MCAFINHHRSWIGERHCFFPNVNVLQCNYSVRYLLPVFGIPAGNAVARLLAQVCVLAASEYRAVD